MRQDLEQLIRAGKRKEVERQLLELTLSKIPRAEVLTIANLARRINRPDLALRMLSPIVRDPRAHGGEATAEEKIEYAMLLRKQGAVPEAVGILERIDATKFPQVNFHLALCCFAQWKYSAAVPKLREYIAQLEKGSYSRTVGQVNLASALISLSSYDEASELLSELMISTKKPESRLLHANCLELQAQVEIFHRQGWDAALAHLGQARAFLGDDLQSNYSLFIRKWEAVAISLRDNIVAESLLAVRDEAVRLRHWETARDCELYIAQITGDNANLLRLYFGTPYQMFRERVKKAAPDLLIPGSYLLSAEGSKPGKTILDLRTAEIEGSTAVLNAGQMLHKILILLSRDFFKPVPILSVFGELFPEEYFNPITSPNRVHQLVRRVRLWAEQEKVPLEVAETESSYRLSLGTGLSVRVQQEELPRDSKELEFLRLRAKLDQKLFSNRDVVNTLNMSRASVQRLLKWASDSGHIETIAGGRSAKYRFVA